MLGLPWELVISEVSQHVQKCLSSQLIQIFGSTDILGNPFGFLRDFALGLQDFVEKPVEGSFIFYILHLKFFILHFIFCTGLIGEEAQTPSILGFVSGIGKGTLSLLSHTTRGLSNSGKSIASSTARGLANLSMDKEYARDHAVRQR